MDINVNTHLKESEINGLFQEVEQLKKQRAALKEDIDDKTNKIIDHILNHGNVLAYKDDVAHILTVSQKPSTKFDKSKLSEDMDVTQSELDYIGIAELVEEKRITSKKLYEYWYEEPNQRLKARKAKKTDLELLRSSRRI